MHLEIKFGWFSLMQTVITMMVWHTKNLQAEENKKKKLKGTFAWCTKMHGNTKSKSFLKWIFSFSIPYLNGILMVSHWCHKECDLLCHRNLVINFLKKNYIITSTFLCKLPDRWTNCEASFLQIFSHLL